MNILTIRSDNPEAEIGLFEISGSNISSIPKDYKKWQAHRSLSETLLPSIDEMLTVYSLSLKDIEGLIIFSGPGSFTGLRIGISTANALAFGLSIPIIGSQGDDWLETGLKKIVTHSNDRIVIPHYGAPVHITQPKK